MKKMQNTKKIMFSVLFCLVGFLVVAACLSNNGKVEAEMQNYPALDLSDIDNTYTFEGTEKYGDLQNNGWELTKNGNDYLLKLKNAKLGKLVLPMDIADKNCGLDTGECGTKPRLSNTTVELIGENLIYGYDTWEDGLVGNYVKKTIIRGNGTLKVKSNHGVNIYSDVVFESGNFDIESKVYGISTNYSLTINGGKYNITSRDSALISADDMQINSATVDATMNKLSNGDYGLANNGVVETAQKIVIDSSKLTLKQGKNSIYGGEIIINDSTITDNGESALNTGIYARGGMNTSRTKTYTGDLIVKNSNIDLKSPVQAIYAAGRLVLDGGVYNLESSTRRKCVVISNRDITVTGSATLNITGRGFGIASANDKGTIRFDSGSKVNIMILGSNVASAGTTDLYAVHARNIYLANDINFEAIAGNQVFNSTPKLDTGSYYIEVGKFAEKNPKYRYPEKKSKESFTTFYSSYRYVKIVYNTDVTAPVISGFQADKTYCEMPTITVKDDTGIDTITVNGEKIRKFVTDKDTIKSFVTPISNSPVKEIVATDVLGNTSKAVVTAYNGCNIDINKATVSLSSTDYTYDGTEKKPIVTLRYYSRLLKQGEDYTVSYKDNVEVGTATVTITGKIGFAGTIVKNYTISKADNEIEAYDITKPYLDKNQTVKIDVSQIGNGKLTYASDNKNVDVSSTGTVTVKKGYIGEAKITIKSTNTSRYNSSSKKITVKVTAPSTSITSLTNVKTRKMTIKWSKKTGITGYEIQYSKDKKFKTGVKKLTVSKNSTISKTVKSLTKNKTYYVRVRTYKVDSDKKYYSAWSKVKSVKIKK